MQKNQNMTQTSLPKWKSISKFIIEIETGFDGKLLSKKLGILL